MTVCEVLSRVQTSTRLMCSESRWRPLQCKLTNVTLKMFLWCLEKHHLLKNSSFQLISYSMTLHKYCLHYLLCVFSHSVSSHTSLPSSRNPHSPCNTNLQLQCVIYNSKILTCPWEVLWNLFQQCGMSISAWEDVIPSLQKAQLCRWSQCDKEGMSG